MITATYGVVRTHDDARDFIRSLAPGVKVVFGSWAKDPLGQAGRYELVFERLGRRSISHGDSYALPFAEATMRKHVTETCERVSRI